MGYIFLAFILCVAELIIKNQIVVKEAGEFPKKILKGHINITRAYNYGLAFNKMEDEPEKVKKITTIFAAVLFLVSIPSLLSKRIQFIKKIGITFLLAGAFSNVADRHIRGYVVDYLRIVHKNEKKSKVTFNIGDVLILIGTFFTIIGKKKKDK